LFCGVTLGIVMAPARGEETRRRLHQRVEQWHERQVERGRETARDVGSAVAERLYDRAVGDEST
jgi:gas vesicle protein